MQREIADLAGVAFSTRCRALSAMRRAPQLGQNPRFLQENASSRYSGLPALRPSGQPTAGVLMPGDGGESLPVVLKRAWRGFARACDGLNDDDTLLLVAHDAVNRVILCRILGIPLSKVWSFRQAPTTLNLLEGPSVERLEVVRLNDCAHHTALFGEAVHRAL